MPEAAGEKWGLNCDLYVCVGGKKIVSQVWLYYWKEETMARVKERGNGGGGFVEQKRFPKLIKCSGG